MHKHIHASTETKHSRDNTKAHEILWLVGSREQVGAVDLSEVAHGVDESERYGADFGFLGWFVSSCLGKRKKV